MTTAYLGDQYSHSFAAVEKFGGDPVRYPTIRAALKAAADGKADRAVVPIENSIEGSVRETLDGLYELPLYIVGEATLPIRQNLIGLDSADLTKVRRVYSHPQALAQCRDFLEKLGAETVPVGSTSEGLARIGDASEAAVARVPRPGQTVIADHAVDVLIVGHTEDAPNQFTDRRFVGAGPQGQQDRQYQYDCQDGQENKASDTVAVKGRINGAVVVVGLIRPAGWV